MGSEQPVLHMLGCGRAARAVARRLLATEQLRPGLIVNRSLSSAREAAAFLGAGQPAAALDERIHGGWLMLGLPDGVLADGSWLQGPALEMPLKAAPLLSFHLSGSIPAEALRPLGGQVAAIHPVRAFSHPEQAVKQFDGTWCVAEGDASALGLLQPLFTAAGGRWLEFAARDKAAWHAATVAASNFLVTVSRLAERLAEQAGLSPAQAAEVLADLQQGTLQAVRELGPKQALTGPVERSDVAACSRLVEAAARVDSSLAAEFADFARATLALAEDKRGSQPGDEALRRLFRSSSD